MFFVRIFFSSFHTLNESKKSYVILKNKINAFFSVIVPHLGTATYRTESDMATLAARNIMNVLHGIDMIAPAFRL